MKAKKLFFKECHLAGRQYHDVDEVWEELHVGTLLELERDLDNRYDKNAVAVIIPLQGDVAMPDDFEDDTESETEDEEDVSREDYIDGEQLLEDNREAIDRICRGCSRFDTVMATDKGVRCSCLSEHFFLGMLEKKSCSLKR